MAWFGGGGGNWGGSFGNMMGGLGDRLRAGGRAMGGGQGMGNPYTQGTGGAYGRGSGGGTMGGGGGGTAGEYAGIYGYGANPQQGQRQFEGGFQQAPGNVPMPILRPQGDRRF